MANQNYDLKESDITEIPHSVLGDLQRSTDSRKYPRKPYLKPVFFTSQNEYFQGVINNISRNGALIETKDNFSIGQIIRLVIPGTKIDNGVMLKAEVVRVNSSTVAVKFRSITKGQTTQ